MYVCVCKAVTDTQIKQAVAEGVETLRELQQALSVGKECGRCMECAKQCMQQALSALDAQQDVHPVTFATKQRVRSSKKASVAMQCHR